MLVEFEDDESIGDDGLDSDGAGAGAGAGVGEMRKGEKGGRSMRAESNGMAVGGPSTSGGDSFMEPSDKVSFVVLPHYISRARRGG